MKWCGQQFLLLSVFLFALAICAYAGDGQPEPTYIHLIDEYVPENPDQSVLNIGDLVKRATSPYPELLQRVKNVYVMDLPNAGEQQRLTKHFVLLAMRKAGINNLYENIKLEAENIIPVYGHGHRVTVEEAVKMLQQHLLQETEWSNENLVLHVMAAPTKDAWLPSKNYEAHINRLSNSLLGKNRYTVEFYIDQIKAESLEFLVSLKRKCTVYVPTRIIHRGDVIGPNDIREKVILVDRDQIEKELVKDLDDILGQRARTSLNENEPIQWRMLETNYVIRPAASGAGRCDSCQSGPDRENFNGKSHQQ